MELFLNRRDAFLTEVECLLFTDRFHSPSPNTPQLAAGSFILPVNCRATSVDLE